MPGLYNFLFGNNTEDEQEEQRVDPNEAWRAFQRRQRMNRQRQQEQMEQRREEMRQRMRELQEQMQDTPENDEEPDLGGVVERDTLPDLEHEATETFENQPRPQPQREGRARRTETREYQGTTVEWVDATDYNYKPHKREPQSEFDKDKQKLDI